MRKKIMLGILAILAGLWLNNTSLFVRPTDDIHPGLLSHRGVHQYFDSTGVGNDECTALLINTPTHSYLENTIPSMQAAFDAGAAIIELDIHKTPDEAWAVFHDWTLDCRTDGTGTTHKTPMSELKKLDIGYGYSADGGATYPLRGTGVGHMPSLTDVFTTFPDKAFLINFKSNKAIDGAAFAAFLDRRSEWRKNIWAINGGPKAIAATLESYPDIPAYSRRSLKSCLKAYALSGWTGRVPAPCRNTVVSVPANYGKFLWGWPARFEARMNKAGSTVVLLGPHTKGNAGTTGIDHPDQLTLIPKGFGGYVWTNRIEAIGPEIKAAGPATSPPKSHR